MSFWKDINPVALVTNAVGNLIGGHQDRQQRKGEVQAQKEMAQQNIAQQERFAKEGLRWKVADAKAAGLHPLAALGASGSSFSPVGIGDTSLPSQFGDMARGMGQDISRAINATRTEDERVMAKLQLDMARAQLQGQELDNTIRASQLQKMNAVGPAFPGADNFIPGQGDSGVLMKVTPSERTASQPGRLAQEAGWRPDVSYSRSDTGLIPMVPEGLSESMEDDVIGKALWRWRNQIVPNFDSSQGRPPDSQLPKGASHWVWNPNKQEWTPNTGYSSWVDRAAVRFGDWYYSKTRPKGRYWLQPRR